jgi:hypothetical protein
MENGDLETQPEQLDTVPTSVDAGLATVEAAATEPAAISLEAVTKESLWQRLRKQPRETAAVVVLVVTAMIWLDSGDSTSKQSQASKSLDPMDGFESYLSDFETAESGTSLRQSADPVDSQSIGLFGRELKIPQTPQSEFASRVTANYGDSAFEPGNSSTNNRASATTAAQYSGDADAYGSPADRTNAGGAASDVNNSGTQQNRKVRFAGRIKPAN